MCDGTGLVIALICKVVYVIGPQPVSFANSFVMVLACDIISQPEKDLTATS